MPKEIDNWEKEFDEKLKLLHPQWEDIQLGGYIQCSCGQVLQTVESTREHWEMGHFDRKQDLKSFIRHLLEKELQKAKIEERSEIIKKINPWEKEFDRITLNLQDNVYDDFKGHIKSFIKSQKAQSYKEGVKETLDKIKLKPRRRKRK